VADNAKESSFRISIDGNAAEASKDIAASARLAAKSITAYETEIKNLSGDLRRLKGNSDEVNAAKKVLKDKIDKARTSVSSLTTELQKQNTTYAQAAAAAKKYGTSVGLGGHIKGALGKLGGKVAASPLGKAIGGAVGPAAKKLGAALEPIGKSLGKFAAAAKPIATSVGPSMTAVLEGAAAATATATAALVAAGAAAIAGAAALAGLSLAAVDAEAKMNRQRQALLGNAKDAKVLGDQIQDLAGKVPQGVEELNALAVSLSKSRLSGKEIVNTMNAVAQATGAVDASAGAKIQELITRGQHTGRLALGQFELQGTGIDFEDVAKEYAAGTKKSIQAARMELFNGVAPLEQGAEAIRKATEKKFAGLNLEGAFSLENAPKKFFDAFKALLPDASVLKPITDGLRDAFAQLSPDAPLGRAVKTFMETFVGGVADIAGKSIPVLLEGFKWMIVGALRVGAYFYETKKQIQDAFSADGFLGAGKAIVTGIIKGIIGEHKFLGETVVSLAKTVKDAFTGDLKIGSPSKVFERYGGYTVEGYAQGVEKGSQRAQGAVTGMVDPGAAMGAAGGGGGGIGQLVVNINGAPTGDAQAMQSPVFLAAITRAVRNGLTGKGVAVAA